MINKIMIKILITLFLVVIISSITYKFIFCVNLIPRKTFFDNPDFKSVQLSYDGKYISYLAPEKGVMNLFIAPKNNFNSSKVITNDTHRGISDYQWTYLDDYLIYKKDNNGDENWHLFSINLKTKKILDLTPFKSVNCHILKLTKKYSNYVLALINNNDPKYHDIYKIDVVSGHQELIFSNKEKFSDFLIDEEFNVRLASKINTKNETEVFKNVDNTWELFYRIPEKDSLGTTLISFTNDGDFFYIQDSRNKNTSVLKKINFETGTETILALNEKADLSDFLINPVTKEIQAASFEYKRNSWVFLDNKIKNHFDVLNKIEEGDILINSRTQDDLFWLIAFIKDNGPVKYYLYDTEKKTANFLAINNKALKNIKLSKMHPVIIKSRDGLDLISYLTLPETTNSEQKDFAKPTQPLPMILLVHGGPFARDKWGCNSTHQWLSSRGYAVLSVNYRGSTGFGKSFLNASIGEWAGKMHDDLIDAVNWAIEQKIADPAKVGIFGGSYGGYAALCGLTFSPDVFACAVDIVGPSNLQTLIETIPPYWDAFKTYLRNMIGGDELSEEGKLNLAEKSPINFIENITKPLLIGQGANDPRVKKAESDQIVSAMNNKKIPVTYVLFPDEGHGWAKPENNLAFSAVTEAFLSEHLGGKCEPVGNDFKNSSIEFVSGKEFLPSDTFKN